MTKRSDLKKCQENFEALLALSLDMASMADFELIFDKVAQIAFAHLGADQVVAYRADANGAMQVYLHKQRTPSACVISQTKDLSVRRGTLLGSLEIAWISPDVQLSPEQNDFYQLLADQLAVGLANEIASERLKVA